MQNAGFMAAGLDERYGKYHVKPEELPEFVEFARKNLYGFNATVPHKGALIALLDEIAPEALAAGSVNTVIVRDGRLYGEFIGGCESLRLSFRFEKRGEGWRGALELLCDIASKTHAMDFDFECVGGSVTVNLVPFYADVGFVGVKQGEGGVALEELEELY
jgi:hypothetical protein